MDKQLGWIVELLEKNGIDYVLDSGTLLGLIRDGDLIKWDKDIDVTVFEKDIEKLPNILEAARKKGYKASLSKYKGLVVGCSISPDNIWHNLFYPYLPRSKIKGNRVVNVSLLRKKRDLYWEPVLFSIGSDKKVGLTYYFWKIRRGIPVLFRRFFPRSKKNKLEIKDKFHKYATRIVPIKYFEKIKKINGLNVPSDIDGYLKFRYGEWEKPVGDWSYMRDDKSFKKDSPEELGFV